MSDQEAVVDGRPWPPPTHPSLERQRDSITSTTSSAINSSVLSSINAQWVTAGLVRPCDHIIQTIRLEDNYPFRQRFLCLLCRGGPQSRKVSREFEAPSGGNDVPIGHPPREYFLLGIDLVVPTPSSPEDTGYPETPEDVGSHSSIGLVFPLMWNVDISLDGDGGFSLRQMGKHLIFKPISVQSLWTIIQTLHMVCPHLRPRSTSNDDIMTLLDQTYPVTSPQSCINDWHYMADVLVRRPASPDRLSDEDKQASDEEIIKVHLRRIMHNADLDDITSKSIRKQLENDMGQNLESFKSFIDKEILVILGQMDPASKILDYLFLGSEWNASNLDELRMNGITHILNVTREIDNFFPGVFTYKNIREYDEESTDLLKYLDSTYRYIKTAKEEDGKVLIHCKMGISRSATVTISYVMKEYSMSLEEVMTMVKSKRSIVNPNKSFRKQLDVYEGILNAIRHRHTYFGLWRSKSESSLANADDNLVEHPTRPLPLAFKIDIKALSDKFSGDNRPFSEPMAIHRPKSWSPNEKAADSLMGENQEGEEGGKVLYCHCFGAISSANHCLHPEDNQFQSNNLNNAQPSRLSSSLSSHHGSFVEARNMHLLVPGGTPVNSSCYNFDPKCACDVEVPLPVPDEPVVVQAGPPMSTKDLPTEAIVHSLSNLPLQVRNNLDVDASSRNQKSMSLPINITRECDTSSPTNVEVAADLLINSSSTTIKTEELSVKTLANMFDFKVNSVPLRPCLAKMEDSRMFQRAKNREGRSSEC